MSSPWVSDPLDAQDASAHVPTKPNIAASSSLFTRARYTRRATAAPGVDAAAVGRVSAARAQNWCASVESFSAVVDEVPPLMTSATASK